VLFGGANGFIVNDDPSLTRSFAYTLPLRWRARRGSPGPGLHCTLHREEAISSVPRLSAVLFSTLSPVTPEKAPFLRLPAFQPSGKSGTKRGCIYSTVLRADFKRGMGWKKRNYLEK
jgi:hypothetical protein